MSEQLEDLAGRILSAAKRAGADAADCMIARGTSLSVEARGGQLEHADRAEGLDLGVRVFVGRSQAIVSASDTSVQVIDMLTERAVAMAREAPEDPYAGLAEGVDPQGVVALSELELADPGCEPTPDALLNDAVEAEAAALGVDGVSQVQGASAGYGCREIRIAASNGFSGGYRRTDRGISCVAIAGTGTGMERQSDGDTRIFQSDLRAASEIGRCAGERAVAMLGARRPRSGAFPVLFDERIAGSLIGHLLAAANGAAIARGSSWLLGKDGTQVLPKGLSIHENPHRKRASGSRPFDAEGFATRPRDIVKDGYLCGWTLDLATARRLGLETTRNAVRGVATAPSPGVFNIELTQGESSRAALLRDMGTGLLVTSMIGSTINPNTGDYSRGASGFWIENGEIAYPVNECTIAGSLPEMLLSVTPANDARMHLSRVVPSLLVEGLTIAGE